MFLRSLRTPWYLLGAAALLVGCETPTDTTAEPAVWSQPAELPGASTRLWPMAITAGGGELHLLTRAHDIYDRWSDGSGTDPRVSVEGLHLHRMGAGAWAAPEQITLGRAGSRLYGSLARDASGRVHAVWAEAHHHNNDPFFWDFAVRYRSRTPAGWTAPETFHETRNGRGPPPNGASAKTGPDGRVHIAFEETQQQYDMGIGTVGRFLVQDGSSWTSQRFRLGTHMFGGLRFHRAGSTDLLALYFDTGDNVSRALRFRAGRWEAPVPLPRYAERSVVDSQGRIHIFWVDGRLKHSFTSNGTTWSTPADVLPEGAPLFPNRAVLIDRRDRIHLIHTGGEAIGTPGFGYSRFESGSWSVVDRRPSGTNFDSPAATISNDDRLHLVWRSGRAQNAPLFYSVISVSD